MSYRSFNCLPALLAGAALALDYILNVAVGISAGVGALVSAFPSLLSHTLALCLAILVLLMLRLKGTPAMSQVAHVSWQAAPPKFKPVVAHRAPRVYASATERRARGDPATSHGLGMLH